MDHGPAPCAPRAVGPEPPQPQLEGGVGLPQGVQQLPELLDLVLLVQPVHGVGVDAVHRRHGRTGLAGQQRAGVGVGVVAQESAGDGLAVHPLHDDERRPQLVTAAVGGHHGGDRHAGRGRGLQEAPLGRHASTGADATGPLTLQDQLPSPAVGGHRGEGPGLPGRAAGQPVHPLHRDR